MWNSIQLCKLHYQSYLASSRSPTDERLVLSVSYALITSETATLFLDAANEAEVVQHLGSDVVCKPYADVLKEITAYTASRPNAKILVDPLQCNLSVFLAIPPQMRKEETSIVMAQKVSFERSYPTDGGEGRL